MYLTGRKVQHPDPRFISGILMPSRTRVCRITPKGGVDRIEGLFGVLIQPDAWVSRVSGRSMGESRHCSLNEHVAGN